MDSVRMFQQSAGDSFCSIILNRDTEQEKHLLVNMSDNTRRITPVWKIGVIKVYLQVH